MFIHILQNHPQACVHTSYNIHLILAAFHGLWLRAFLLKTVTGVGREGMSFRCFRQPTSTPFVTAQLRKRREHIHVERTYAERDG